MIRTALIALTASLMFTGVAQASATTTDHSGFGHNLFASRAPAAFSDPIAYTDNMDAAAAMANNIEPATGAQNTKSAVSVTR